MDRRRRGAWLFGIALLLAVPLPPARAGHTPRPTGEGAPIVLVDNSARAWGMLPYPRGGAPTLQPKEIALIPRDFFSMLSDAGYDVRFRLPWGETERPPVGLHPLTAEELAGVDLVVLPWQDCAGRTGDGQVGSGDVDLDPTPEEVAALSEWMRQGGQLLVFAALSDPACRSGLLFRTLGIELGERLTFEPARPARGELAGREYGLLLYDAIPIRHSGLTLIHLDGEPVAALSDLGRGRAAVIASGGWLYHRARGEPMGGPIPLLEGDNLAFLLDLFAHLTGWSGQLDLQHATWRSRLEDLGVSLFSLRMTSVEQLLEGQPRAGPAWKPTAEERRLLEGAREKLERAQDTTLEANRALDRRDYAAVEQHYREAVRLGREGLAQARPVEERFHAEYGRWHLARERRGLALGLAGRIGLWVAGAAGSLLALLLWRQRQGGPHRS